MKSSEKNSGNTILKRQKSNTLRWYGPVVRMEENIWPKRIVTWSLEESEDEDDKNKVGKVIWEGDEAEEFNMWRPNYLAIITTENQ